MMDRKQHLGGGLHRSSLEEEYRTGCKYKCVNHFWSNGGMQRCDGMPKRAVSLLLIHPRVILCEVHPIRVSGLSTADH